LKEENIEAELDKESDSVFAASAGGITHWKAFLGGLCQVQDVTAQQAVIAAELRPGKIVLDLAAGAGTKSTQAAEIMRNDGLVIAHDVATARLDRIASNAARLGIEIIEVVPPDKLDATLADYDLDVILVDVPCSNTGVFARRPEAKYRQTPQSLVSLKKQQIAILRRAMSLAADSGGRIVYSTCSIEPEEDEQVIQEVMTGQSEWIVADAHLFAPTFTGPITSWRDGGYVAVIDSAVKGG
jgi:16S rRNA (cytosine967-C5)-methyltransferase